MAYSNNNKRIHDTPILLPTAQFRTATNALASMTTDKTTNDRYIYYCSGALFYKYDTYTDTHIKLASPPTVPVTKSVLKYSADEGYRGFALVSSTGNTITIAGFNSDALVGSTIVIETGLSVNQQKTITAVSATTEHSSGIVTSATANSLTDATKRWEINQYIGYQVRLVYNTGASQIRKILYNDATTLTFFDANSQQLDSWNNTPFSATAPYAIPVATAGSQTNYSIESTVLTVDSPWISGVNTTSSYVIKTGGVFLLSSAAATPFTSFQYYSVITDTWTSKTALGGNLLAALGTDYDFEIITTTTPYETGTTTSATSRTLTDNTKNMVVNKYVNCNVKLLSSNGASNENRIVANGTNYFEVARPWRVTPSASDSYEIEPSVDKMFLVGNGASSMYHYSVFYDQWTTGPSIDYGSVRNISCKFGSDEPLGVTTGVRNTGGITVLNSVPTAGGTGYIVGDLFNITTGGTVAKGRVEAVTGNGVVTLVSLYSAGLNYTTGSGKATTIISGGGNNGLTVDITTVGVVGRITTASNCNYIKGDAITISGCTDATWNTTYNILAIDALNTFDVITTAAASMVATASQSTTLIVDADSSWVVNEHIGKIVKLDVAGTSPTSQFRRITSNTATSLTVPTIVAGTNGTSRYAIMEPQAFGRDRQYPQTANSSEGMATSGTTLTLTDTSKTWVNNQWTNHRIRIVAGLGVGTEAVITASTSNTLSITSLGFTPDTTTKYSIMATYGTATAGSVTTLTDSTKNWTVNQWAGKRLIYTSGTGQRTEVLIASNTATVLTFGSTTAPDTTTTYTILGLAPRSTGTNLQWLYNTVHDRGRYLFSPRGGGNNTIDKYDITLDRWDFTEFYTSQSEILNTGSSYAYDGESSIYFTVATAADFIYVNKLNLDTVTVSGAFQTTALQGTVHIGNLMNVVSSPDGGKFLFLGIDTSRLMYKTLIS